MNDLLHELRRGKLDVPNAEFLAGTRLSDLVSDFRNSYPVLFQGARMVGRSRHKMGMARSIQFRLAACRLPGSRFRFVQLHPVLWRCVFVSRAYDDAISEVTQVASIRIRPARNSVKELILRTGRGFKLDKISDQWLVKPLKPREVTLSGGAFSVNAVGSLTRRSLLDRVEIMALRRQP